ncbi:MAG: hypothetical protein KDI79_21335 [Anaerolineae bacterium]|nr:hypothetical protein [Anaerolineae bacterium]
MDPTVAELIVKEHKIAYIVTDDDLKILDASPNAGHLFQGDSLLLLGKPLIELIPELKGNEAVLFDILRGKVPRFDLFWLHRVPNDQPDIYLSLVILPYHQPSAQITGLTVLIQDVTPMGQVHQLLNQHRNELNSLRNQLLNHNAELNRANAELQQLDDVKSTFISVAAHELQTPLSSITGFIEMLSDEVYGSVNEEQKEALDIVQRSATRLIAIIKNLLDVTRIEAGRIELALRPINIHSLIEAVVAEFRPQIEVRQQTLTLNFQTNLPFALCDYTRATQIVSNLLSNAMKYTPNRGAIELKTYLDTREGFIRFSVTDNGVGISNDDQKLLFKRFFRAESANLTGEHGTGLGLYITRSLVELHGGQIWVESELWRGSQFHVTFPVAGRPTVLEETQADNRKKARKHQPTP